MLSMADRLRSLHEYASTHRSFDLGLLLDAADQIERLEIQAQEQADWYRENFPELYRPAKP